MRDALLEAATDLELGHRVDEGGCEGVVDARLHVDAVRADAGLARGAELGGDGPGDGGGEVGVVEDDEGRVAAELEGEFLEGRRGLRHERLAYACRAGEGDFLDDRGGADGFPDGGCVGGGRDDIDDAFGDAGAYGELGEREGREGCLAGGLADDGAAGGEGGADFTRDHGGGEVPSVVC